MPLPIQSVSSDEAVRDSDAGDGVIENISTLHDGRHDAPPGPEADAAVLSLSSATSATSAASALSNGAPRPSSRPRSASLHLPAGPHGGGTPLRQRSAPRVRRPGSNPRTRTPMRAESPLMVATGGRVATEEGSRESEAAVGPPAAEDGNGVSAASTVVSDGDEHRHSTDNDEAAVRNIFNVRRRRAASIPEEEEVTASAEPSTAVAPPPRAAGHWFARAATANASTARSNRPAETANARGNDHARSDKQRPSHRKLRRWDNDRFVGTPSEQLHLRLERDGGAGADLNWTEFYMPHYPLEYRSEFAKLATDDSKFGRSVRDRFAKGEVGAPRGGDATEESGDTEEWTARRAAAKLRKMGISPRGKEDEMGKQLFQALYPRVRSVISRACAVDDFRREDEGAAADAAGGSFAGRAVTAFESYLVSLAIAGPDHDVVVSEGYPPRQPQSAYDIFAEIFSGPPKVVIRRKKQHRASSSARNGKHLHAVMVPTVHFYFSAAGNHGSKVDGSGGGGSQQKGQDKSAFYRILLYAVCQFHGLESSSSMIASDKKKKKPRDGHNRGDHEHGAVKVVTVQGGVMLAPELKLLDYAR